MSRIYDPYKNIKDYSFDIQSSELTNMILTKANLDKKTKMSVKAYAFEEQREIVLIHNRPIRDKIKDLITLEMRKKALLQWGSDLKVWLKGYKFEEIENNWFVYVDETGLKDIVEIRLKFLNKSLEVIEKRPTGDLNTKYLYKAATWAGEQLVLDKVIQEVVEGDQFALIKSKITYGQVDKVGHVPTQVDVQSLQEVRLNGSQKIERHIKEKYVFNNFRIQEDVSKNWFQSSP